MKRRGHGEGSVHQRGDGRWVGVIDLGWQNGKRRRKYVYASSQQQVVSKMNDARARVAAGLPLPPERLTVESYLREWVSTRQPEHLSANTTDNYRWASEHHIVPALGKKRLRQLTPKDVADMLASKAAEGLGRSSRMRLRSVLGRALRQAEAEGLVSRNAATLIPPTSLGRTSEGRSLTVDQARSLLAGAKPDRLGGAVIVMLTMGLRPGEVLGLSWDDVDLRDGVLKVRHSLKRERTGLRLGAPKTPRSRRTLAMPGVALDALRRRHTAQLAERLQAGPRWLDTGLVFTTSVGSMIDPNNFRRHFGRLSEAAGVGHWTPNEMRHSAVSLLSAAEVPLEDIADLVGHDGTRMTGGVYRHVLAPVNTKAVAPMDKLFGTGRD
jgi:integrase